jgi:hypothetical protein
MFLPPIQRPFGVSMKMGYNFMTKMKLVENKTLSREVVALTYKLVK